MTRDVFLRRLAPWLWGAVFVAGARWGALRGVRLGTPPDGSLRFSTATLSAQWDVRNGRFLLKNQDRTSHWEGTLSAFVDGVATPLRVRAQDLRRRENRGRDEVLAVELASEGSELVLDLFMKFDPEKDAFVLALEGVPSPDIFPHDVALGVTLPLQKEDIFVSGVGPVGDIAEVMGRLALLGSEPQSVGFVSLAGPLDVQVRGEPRFEGGLAVDVKSPKAREGRAVLALAMAPTESRLFENLYALGSMETREVQGMVTGTEERARVFSLDESGAPQLRVSTDERGQFRLQAPAEASSWYATAGETLTSEPVEWNPTAETPLVIDVSPGGELRAVVRDADLGQAVTARLFVKGLDGTPDPNFGPDYRASGAGVLVDSLRGAFVTPLPAGRYRVSGTRGLEYSVDSKDVEVRSGRISKVELDLRRVAPTPGALGCDLHVHARPSFDSPVTPEDRVLSLVAAGIEFAVPTEHNVVGDYGPSLDLLGLSRELLWVPGVEVTTYSPRFGHVGVFPYPPGGVPPYEGTTMAAVIEAARLGDASRIVQLNHPRMPYEIGYFDVAGWAGGQAPFPRGFRSDFDALEIYNGFDGNTPAHVDRLLQDWFAFLNRGLRPVATGSSDAHRIQYNWAGYPRTYVDIGPMADGPLAGVEPKNVVAALKKGRAFVTSGPLVHFRLNDAAPGDEVVADGQELRAKVQVRAAPWVDVTRVELVVDGQVVQTHDVPSRPAALTFEGGALGEIIGRTIRFDEELVFRVPPRKEPSWVAVVVRGTRAMDDVLPYMPIVPMAFTNPIWLRPSSESSRSSER